MINRILISTLALLTFQISFSQQLARTYYTKDGKITKNTKEAYYYRMQQLLENTQVKIMEKYIENDQIKLLGTQHSFNVEHYIGQKIESYENGKIKSKELYSQDGKLIDTAVYYYPNGQLKLMFQYPFVNNNNQTKVTDTLILVYQDSLGERLLVEGNGYAEFNNGYTIEKGNFKNHKRVGTWTGSFQRGKYTFTETYDNGTLLSGLSKDSANHQYPYDQDTFEKEPEYLNGGIQEFRRKVASLFHYPHQAIQNQVQGTLELSFVINTQGEVSREKVKRDLGHGTAEAGLSALKRAGKWTPGIQRGVPVNVQYSIPLRLQTTN